MNKLLVTLVFVITLNSIGVMCLRCFHCMYATVESYKNLEFRQDDIPTDPSFPFSNCPTCIYGNDPESNLSINCETEASNIASSLKGFSKDFGIFESKIREVLRSAQGASFVCMTMEFRHQINFNGRELTMHTTNFTADLVAFNIGKARGYTCGLEDNCNGNNGDQSTHLFVTREENEVVKSSESVVAGLSYILLLFLFPFLWVLF